MSEAAFTLPLSLRLVCGAKTSAPSAWLLPVADPAMWLEELCGWGVPLQNVKLLLLPRSVRDRSAGAALTIVPLDLAAQVHASGLAEPYVSIAGRLFIPAGTRLRYRRFSTS